MKRNVLIFLLAAATAVSLMGCASENMEPSREAVPVTEVPNDAAEGGGAGGTSDQNNDGMPDSTPGISERVEDSPMEDLGDAAGDVMEGAGDAVEKAGDAVGDTARKAGEAMQGK